MIELRWLVTRTGHIGSIVLSGEARVLQYRYQTGHGVITNEHGQVTGMEPAWSDWKDTPVHYAAEGEGGKK